VKFTKRQMILQMESTRLDKHRSANFLGEYGCADVFGGTYLGNTSGDLLDNLKYLGVDVSEWSYIDGYWMKGDTESVVEEVTIPEAEDLVVEEKSPEIESTEEVDWEWINTLENKKYDKVKLDEYAAEKFDIKLNQRNTIENMIIDFKTQLENN
jgi:hypothetical protein